MSDQTKEFMLGMLRKSSQEEIQFTKDQNFIRAIDFALEEVEELQQQYVKFIQSVQHLVVFQEIVKEPLTKDMQKMTQNIKYLIEKNYTKEDRDKMPIEILGQVKSSQEKRLKLLTDVARKYFHHPKKD